MPDEPRNPFLFKSTEGSRTFERGETIFSEGDAGAEMFAVQQGWVDLTVAGTVVETVAPGGIFGELSLIDGAPRSATAVAGENCRVVAIDEKRFDRLTKEETDFAITILRVISQRIRQTGKL
jgi:CRP/FNR family transcriptional regulator, cyclic AMP receptor protein